MPKTLQKNNYYPIFLNIAEKLCVVVGGGLVAEQKIRMLLKFNMKIKVISPVFTKHVLMLYDKGRIAIIKKAYTDGDLQGAVLAFAATDNKSVNEAVKSEAKRKGIPVNVVDDPELCDFIVPSIVKKKSIVIAISTSGTLPLLSKILRKDIERLVSDDYLKVVEKIGEFRKYLIQNIKSGDRRKKILDEIRHTDIKYLAGMDSKTIKNRFLRNNQ